ncbi:ATP-binding protein [Rhodopirellula bahusiensis]|uniref:histidine kinase n=1 Tax=Rhodopirellula bahusiensis TaxID=2014065 RepID=A0A2G1W4L6_9BACT|nr:ATP-binding protein [Rhodopirellula bahusiensis]PHQ33966.1 hybrid sensor histidine kinase/response regulator [Rhodopirellula bahusiensis]
MQFFNHILVIEDDLDAAESLSDVLSIEGFEVTIVASVHEALEVLGKKRFGLILTDRRLPDGLIEDRVQDLLAASAKTPVIVVTGYSDLQAAIKAFRQGISDYVIKPIIPEDLIQTVRRILDRRVLKQELVKEHAFAERLQSTAEAIILVLDFNGQVVHFNRFLTELTGWTQDDLIGENWFEKCIFTDDLDRLSQIFETTARLESSRGVTNRIRCKNGEAREFRWSNSKLNDDEGCPQFVLSIGIDVSDLAEATQRAVRAERLAAIGETVAALAHESRNAIQRIKAASEVLAMDIRNDSDSEEELSAIQRAASDLATLLESVRAFAAPIHTKLERVDLEYIWQRAWNDLESKWRLRDAKLIEMASTCEHEVEVDVCRMEQVFRNLFTNALEATDGSVRIEMDCSCDERQVHVRIKDNGPGLTEEQANHMFEPFYTTKPTGTGLGMPICQRIIEAHGGTIMAESFETGTKVSICVPREKTASLMGLPEVSLA